MNSPAFHITYRSHQREFFPLPLDYVWVTMTNELAKLQQSSSFRIHAFVLMGNHFHLLCKAPLSNTEECLQAFDSETSKGLGMAVEEQHENQYYISSISSRRHYNLVYRYIHQNPLRAKIVNKVEDYPYSTLRKDLPFALHSNVPMGFCGEEGERIWLNLSLGKEEAKSIRAGLKKSQFENNIM